MAEASANRPPTVAREAALVLGARVATALMAGVLGVVLARLLGTREYGLLVLSATVIGIAGLLSDLGIGESTARFAAEAYPDRARTVAIARLGLRLRTVFATGVIVAVLLGADGLASLLGEPTVAPLLRIACLTVAAADLFDIVQATLLATRRSPAVIALTLFRGALEFVLVIALLRGVAPTASWAILGTGVAWSITTLAGVALFLRRNRSAGTRGEIPDWRGLLGYGRRIWLANIAFVGFISIDQLLLNALIGVEAVGLYDPPFRLVATSQLLANSVVAAVCPRMTGDREVASRIFERVLRALLSIYTVLGLVVFALAPQIVAGLLGDQFARSADVLRWFLPYMVLMGIASLVSVSLNFLGATAGRQWIALGAVTINAIADLILIPTVGLAGPAIGTALAFTFYVGGHIALCRRQLSFSLRKTARTAALALGVGLVAAAAAAGTAHVTPLPALGEAIVGGIAGLAVGVAGLIAVRELGGDVLDVLRHR